MEGIIDSSDEEDYFCEKDSDEEDIRVVKKDDDLSYWESKLNSVHVYKRIEVDRNPAGIFCRYEFSLTSRFSVLDVRVQFWKDRRE